MAVNSAVLQLVAAVSSLTFVLVTGFEALLGLGPAIFLTASALTAFPAGWSMDRFGRVPVIVVGFLLGAIGCALTALGTATEQAVPVIVGFALIGSSGGVSLLIRTAAGDMYPTERRARNRLRPERRRRRRDPRPRRLQSDLLRQGRARCQRLDDSVAGCRCAVPRRPRARSERPARPEAHRRADRAARGRPPSACRAAERDRPPSGRDPGAPRGVRVHGRDGLRHEPDGLRRRRAPRSRPACDLPDHRGARARHVRARARERTRDRPRRPHARARGRAHRHGRLVCGDPGLRGCLDDRRPALRPRTGLERLVRCGHGAARRPVVRRPSAASCSASTTSAPRSSVPAWHCSAASSSTCSA